MRNKSILLPIIIMGFGFNCFSQAVISGKVFNDISGNNSFNPGEELNNVTVWLLDLNAVAPYYRVSPVQTTTTDVSGNYSFTSVAAGNYQVRVVQSSVPATISRAISDNDSYPNGITEVMGVTGTNTYTNIDFGFAATATTPVFTSLRNFQWNTTNDFVNESSKTFALTPETISGTIIYPTINWTTDRTIAPGGGYGTNTYPQAAYPSAVLGQDFPGNNKGGIQSADNTFQLIYGGTSYTTINNDRQTTTIQFSVPVINTKFSIYDIDHADPQRATGRIDHVKVTGYNNSVPVMPVIANPSIAPWNTVSGNTIYGFADYPLGGYTLAYNSQNEDHGTVNVYFSYTIDRIVIEYEEWAPVMLPGKGIWDATPPNLATNESVWVDRSGANAPTYRGISIGSIGYTVDDATIILPLRLKDFTLTKKNCSLSLNWETINEENFDFFDIEYAKEGSNFLSIAKIPATNNMNGATYSYNVPPHIISGFFRLKMQDVDGKYKYSDITSANLPCSKINWFVMGNPVVSGTETSINISKLDDTFNDCNVLVFDIVGKKILQQNFSLRQGTQTIILNTNAIKAGTYIIGIYDTNNRPLGEVKKLVIQ